MNLGMLTNITALVVSISALVVSIIFALRQLKSAKTSNDMVVAVELLSREIASDRFRESEDYIIERLPQEHSPDLGVWKLPSEARSHVYRIAWYYTSLGHLAVFGAVDERLILSMVSYRLRRSWFVLEPYIRTERAIRKAPFFAFFEHIACRASQTPASEVHRQLNLLTFSDSNGSGGRAFPGEGEFRSPQVLRVAPAPQAASRDRGSTDLG
jgi:hypothetical protein